MTKVEYAPERCPLCGQDNACAIAAGRSAESCWCFTAELSRDALQAIPAEAVNRYCICAACGRVAGDKPVAR